MAAVEVTRGAHEAVKLLMARPSLCVAAGKSSWHASAYAARSAALVTGLPKDRHLMASSGIGEWLMSQSLVAPEPLPCSAATGIVVAPPARQTGWGGGEVPPSPPATGGHVERKCAR